MIPIQSTLNAKAKLRSKKAKYKKAVKRIDSQVVRLISRVRNGHPPSTLEWRERAAELKSQGERLERLLDKAIELGFRSVFINDVTEMIDLCETLVRQCRRMAERGIQGQLVAFPRYEPARTAGPTAIESRGVRELKAILDDGTRGS